MTAWFGAVSLPVRVLAVAAGKLGAFSSVNVAETVSVRVAGSNLSMIPASVASLTANAASPVTVTLTPVSPTSLSF